jgi:DNA adenine methylase
MGFGASSIQRVTGFRANSTRSGTTPAHDWANFPAALEAITERLSGVAIENRCALAVMRAHDSPDTVHYVDPPYMADTRGSRDVYRHEMRDEQHIELLTFLKTLSGTVILSGYESAIYLDHLSHWIIRSKDSFADGARPRKEIIFMNRAAPPSGLFAQIATPYSPSCEKG